MGIRRIIYAAILAASVFFYILYPFWFAWYLFLLILLILPFDFLISLPGMLTRHISLSSPKFLECGEGGIVVLTTHQITRNGTRYPCRCVKLWMNIIGDDFNIWRRYVVGANEGSRFEITIDTTCTGLTTFKIKRIWAVSLIGLFCLPAQAVMHSSVLILPPPEKPPQTVTLPRGIILRPKPGGGFAEDYDLRPYRLGDPIRSVHWKVSAKFDSLIIREPLIPPAHSRLVQINLWKGARERDTILSHLRWICAYLLKWDLAHYIRLGENGPIAEVNDNNDLLEYLFSVLDGADNIPAPQNIPLRFAWVFRVDIASAQDKEKES